MLQVSHPYVMKIRDQQGGNVTTDAKGNVRPRKPKPTQAEFDSKELREAFAILRGFPYPGEGLAKRLGQEPDDEKAVT